MSCSSSYAGLIAASSFQPANSEADSALQIECESSNAENTAPGTDTLTLSLSGLLSNLFKTP